MPDDLTKKAHRRMTEAQRLRPFLSPGLERARHFCSDGVFTTQVLYVDPFKKRHEYRTARIDKLTGEFIQD